ncbi:methyltransferase domain-containing protein [Methylobacterium marchantiae]|uniref:Methyltransferase domain-containing protein n=1 Tax=Methylobacterium marchantiae TaxID=600331 RepID=A0ABW3X390_9HYPH|nr:hypothetical protein AIGOOFII_1658 [Methylobacterium marchantiae]
MFIGLPEQITYSDPWDLDFDTRFRTLISRPRRIAYYYTTPDNSTFRYRVYNTVQTVNAVSTDTSASWFCQADGERLEGVVDAADVLILGRVRFDNDVEGLIRRARRRGARVLFDLDDLVYDTRHVPLLMSSLNQDTGPSGPWDYWYSYIGRMGTALRLCDGVITTNLFLASQIAADTGLPTSIVPNYLNEEQLALSRSIVEIKQKTNWARSDRIHIGYFSGSPTHARDFSIIAPTLANLLRENPSVILRIVGMLDLHPDLSSLKERVEIHPFTDFLNLQRIIGSTEVNLAPLQDNIFTNSKSELKFFEAAAVATLTIASPTFTFRNAIDDGLTGLLANELEWADKIRLAITMIENGRYASVALEAAKSVRKRYGSSEQWPAIERAAFGELVSLANLSNEFVQTEFVTQREVTRRDSILSMLKSDGFGLEIGPSYNPLLPKSAGFNIETVDYITQSGLRKKYAGTLNVDIDRIECVDHVTNGQPLAKTIPADRCYDFILASHVIEHTPDLISFLNDCANFLEKEGRLVLAVPDKRFCFDLLQPLTYAGEVLQAHDEKRTRPAPMAIMASIAYDVLRGDAIGWSPQTVGKLRFAGDLDAAVTQAELARQSGDYVDVHCWRFVPSSFRLLIEDLYNLGKIRLRECSFQHQGAHEFFVALTIDGPGPGFDRDTFALMIAEEVAMRRL